MKTRIMIFQKINLSLINKNKKNPVKKDFLSEINYDKILDKESQNKIQKAQKRKE